MAKWGFPLDKNEVKSIVREYMEINKFQSVFGQKGPRNDWFRNFIKRNHLSLKKPKSLEAVRRKATGAHL